MKITQRQDYSQLFNNLPARNNQNNIFNSINLSDYATVKNGSYGKLLKAYYAPEKTDTKNSSKTTSDIKQADEKDIKKEASNVKEKAGLLNNAFDKITDNSKEINKDDIKAFTDRYNDMLKAGSTSSDNVTKAMTSGLKSLSSRNSSEMQKLGIEINKDGSLKFDEKTFENVSDNKLSNSFTKDMKKYIENIEKQAQEKINNMSSYDNKASVSNALNSGFGFDTFI